MKRSMTVLDPVMLFQPPLHRKDMGLLEEEGNTVLLVAEDLETLNMQAARAAGCIYEGIRFSLYDRWFVRLFQEMELHWCAWVNENFMLVVYPHRDMTVLADRIVVARLEEQMEKQEGVNVEEGEEL